MFFCPESRPSVGVVDISYKCEKAVGDIVFKVVRCECVDISFETGVCVGAS